MHSIAIYLACVAGVEGEGEGEGEGKNECAKRVRVTEGVGDACKNAIDFFIPPPN